MKGKIFWGLAGAVALIYLATINPLWAIFVFFFSIACTAWEDHQKRLREMRRELDALWEREKARANG
jgi:hypothetical protein